jgi:hypothetical protein
LASPGEQVALFQIYGGRRQLSALRDSRNTFGDGLVFVRFRAYIKIQFE